MRGHKVKLAGSVVLVTTIIVLAVTGTLPSSLPFRIRPRSKENLKYPNSQHLKLAESNCLGAAYGQAEDIFCLERPTYLRNYKNPCWRDENQNLRCLPYFHLGTSKCGSTDLFIRVKQHPDVLGCSGGCIRDGKETLYWAWNRYSVRKEKQKFSEYIKMFDPAAQQIENQTTGDYHQKIIGDGSPMDFWDFRGWPQIPQNQGLTEPKVLTPHFFKHMYRDFKMVLIMRNPVDRLYSDYYIFNRKRGVDYFHQTAVESVNMMRQCLRNNSIAACFYSQRIYGHLPTRIHIGCYAVFLKVWLSVFPRENFLFLTTEDYRNSPGKTLMKVFDFLGLRSLDASKIEDIVKLENRNENKKKKRDSPMFNKTRAILNDFYAEYNAELASILKDERFLWGNR